MCEVAIDTDVSGSVEEYLASYGYSNSGLLNSDVSGVIERPSTQNKKRGSS